MWIEDSQQAVILPDSSPCGPNDNTYQDLKYIALICSGVIILCLCCLEQRSEKSRCQCCRRRPGLVFPVNLLDHGYDNFGYAMAFGSVASTCFELFFDTKSFYEGYPTWSTTLVIMLNVLTIGLMFYPLFACLTTSWILIGSLFGMAFTVFWLYITVNTLIECPYQADTDTDNHLSKNIIRQIPVLFCMVCLFFRYTYTLVRHSIYVVKTRNVKKQFEQQPIATECSIAYVKHLLLPACTSPGPEMIAKSKWHERIRSFVSRSFYINDPMFNYSPRIICLFTVTLICAYQFGILIIIYMYQLQDFISRLYPDASSNSSTNSSSPNEELSDVRIFLKVLNTSAILSFIISSILTVLYIFQILTSYRMSIKQMYKGNFKHLPFTRDTRHPQFLLSDSLGYAGTQIANILWGYIVMFAVLLLVCVAIAYTIVLPIFNVISREVLKIIALNVLPGFIIMQMLYVVQTMFCRSLLQTKQTVDAKGRERTTPVLALNNRKVYHNISYFLFFFYIVLGLFGCFLTIMKGVVLGVVYLARIDRCGLVSGYETWDKGYVKYVSFLYIEESHRHPILLVFCDILLGAVHDKNDMSISNYGSTDVGDELSPNSGLVNWAENRINKRVRNRWFKMYTLIRNSSIIQKNIEDDFVALPDAYQLLDLGLNDNSDIPQHMTV